MDQGDSTGADAAPQTAHRLSEVLALFPLVRDERLRTLQKCGLVQPTVIRDGERFISFADVVVIRQIHGELQRGASFRSILRSRLASHAGQLAFDFRVDTQPAKVISLKQPPSSAPVRTRSIGPGRQVRPPQSADDPIAAEQCFALASSLDDGSPETQDRAAAAYRRALELDPRLVPAMINLANIHYSRDCLIEAMALYERAVALEPETFEGYFNLGNIHHDLGRFKAAEQYYLQALGINPRYPEAHLYLAVALEKDGRSEEARPHWKAYHSLAPDGEWADLAREFSEQ